MIRLKVDGKEVTGHKGQTILGVAEENGIRIPTLCHDQRLESYGGCGLCVVEVEGKPKLMRACATEITSGMVIKTHTPRVRESRKLSLELLFSDHSGDCRPPCVLACPGYVDCQGYAGLIANKQYREAVALIKERLPLPSSIGRVCPHPCETACRRALVDQAVSIADLKFFVGDQDLLGEDPFMPEIKPATGKKIAVVGAGPAGLTAAYFLAREGHQVTVYDAMSRGGGMLRYGIPAYRLPEEILEKEIRLIAQMGVRFIYNTRIGLDLSIRDLRDAYDAVFVGIGAWESSSMRCKGEELAGVLGGIDFLRGIATGESEKLQGRVAVVGGGNTAMDAARSAIRLGAEEVVVFYRRTREEMPAEKLEIEEAEEEGVKFRFLVSPLEVIAKDGIVNSLRLQKMELGEPDQSGRRRPIPIPGAEEIIAIDTVISAIGQRVELRGLEELEQTEWGSIAVDQGNMMTNLPGVFAGGDVVTGPGIAIEAVAQGRRAALAIDSFLRGENYPEQEVFDKYLSRRVGLTPEDFSHIPQAPRARMPQLAPEKRIDNFQEINLGLSEEEAIADAMKCLECGCRDFYECKLIRYAQDYDLQPERVRGSKHQERVLEAAPLLQRDSDKCILCGLCVRVCEEVMGVTALGLVERGFETLVKPEFGLPLQETDCIHCGMCVALCPTGALVEQMPIAKNLPMEMERREAICTYCGVGCEQIVNTKGDLITRALPAEGGLLCCKGSFGFPVNNEDRLRKPLLRKDGKIVETSWSEAMQKVADGVLDIQERIGESQALGVAVSPAYSLEDLSAISVFAHLGLKTEQVGSFTPNVVSGLGKVFGGKLPSVSMEELDDAELIILIGSFTECPVATVKAREAAKRGVKLVVVGSGKPTLADDLALLKVIPENNTDFIKEILAALMQKDLIDEQIVSEQVQGFSELKGDLEDIDPGEEAQELADIYGGMKKVVILVDGHDVSRGAVEFLGDLLLLTGKERVPGAGIMVITPGINGGVLERVGNGCNKQDLREALKAGELQGLFIFGEDPVGAGLLPPEELSRLSLLVVVSSYKCPTADHADLVIPFPTSLESGGTFITAGGERKGFSSVMKPLVGLTRGEIIVKMASALGVKTPIKSEIELDEVGVGKDFFVIPSKDEIFCSIPVLDPALRNFYARLSEKGIR